MDRSRKANRADSEVTLQHQSQTEMLMVEELAEEKLAQLQKSVARLKQTSSGTAMLERRAKSFGECSRSEGETSGQFHARLKLWLDRRMPQTKSPLHPPRQTGH